VTGFRSVLVANRGEIARRVIRAARTLGLRTVAVYSDADRTAPHVREADDALRIGPAEAAASYLSIDAVLGAARRAGAEALHPGYGFLAESADLARACVDADVVFVGPSPEAMERMGRKTEARAMARAAGVPVVPGVELGANGQAPDLADVGWPVMVKASSGGGGKGMRAVRDRQELDDAIAGARREAVSAFGEGTLLVERLLERPRHVEVQVLGDAQGNVVHLGERDCSVQRRHQKVVEEAPAPTISDGVREELCRAAVRLAREVGYVGAGTVEFVVEGDDFFFLEMNTRLQVEHPVTEEVCGIDLVEWQLRVAAGEAIPFAQEEISARGHAIEARVYAEDPANGFLPQAGTASAVRWPSHARVEAALEAGQEVGTWYDPMVAKIVARGPDREAAREALLRALDQTAVFGLTTNLGFLRRLVASEAFERAEIDTAWLDAGGDLAAPESPQSAARAAAWARAARPPADPREPFSARDGWRLAGPPAPLRIPLVFEEARRDVTVRPDAGTLDDAEGTASVRELSYDGERLVLELDGRSEVFHLHERPDAIEVVHRGESHVFLDPELLAEQNRSEAGEGSLLATMPGTVLRVEVAPGEEVSKGQTLVVLEAMKMELSVSAPFGGVVESVGVSVGDRVPVGQLLAEVGEAGGGRDVT